MKLKSILVGIAGGSASGLTGIGGGTVLVPLLTGTLKMPQRQAHATSLAIVISVGIAAVIPYLRAGHCLLYTSPSPRDLSTSRMPSSA